MSDPNFDGVLEPEAGWPDVPQASVEMLLLGGIGGPLNEQANKLTQRTNLLKARTDITHSAVLSATAEFGDVPAASGEGPVVETINAVSQSLANRTKFLLQNLGAVPVPTYEALRAYTGDATRVFITGLLVTVKPSSIAGIFQHDQTDTTSADNGGTVIVDATGRRWKRDFSGPVNVLWFGQTAAAIQAAINAAGQSAKVQYPKAEYTLDSSVTLLPRQEHIFEGATVNVAAGVRAFTRTTDGFPGRITFSGVADFIGTGKTGRAISITSNTPFVSIGDGLNFSGFEYPVLLDGSYGSYVGGVYVGNKFGPHVLNESHATIINAMSDHNDEAGVGINGNNVAGQLGATPIHNITLLGYYQHTKHGVWAENYYELRLQNLYHEGNTHSDLKLGVADGGTYARAAYHTIIDGWQSSSPCASGRNIDIEHAVALQTVGLAFNAGTSSSATVLQADGYSDKLDIDYHRVQHASIGATTPFNVPAGRAVIRNSGDVQYPWARKSIVFGPLGSRLGAIWGTYTAGGRPTLQIESLGSSQDMTLKVQDIERHEDANGFQAFQIDHINDRVNTGYILQPSSDNVLDLGGVTNRFAVVRAGTGSIVTSDGRLKQQIRPLSEVERAVGVRLKSLVRAYKFNDAVALKGDEARIHVGWIAQEVQDAFEAEGLDAMQYGIVCYDEWEDQFDVDGNLLTPAGNRYGIRYLELMAFLFAVL